MAPVDDETAGLLPSTTQNDAPKPSSWRVPVAALFLLAALAVVSESKWRKANMEVENAAVLSSSSFCLSANNQDYEKLPSHTLTMYKMSMILEPNVVNVLSVSACDSSSSSSIEDYSVKWTAEAVEDPTNTEAT